MTVGWRGVCVCVGGLAVAPFLMVNSGGEALFKPYFTFFHHVHLVYFNLNSWTKKRKF